MRALLEPDAVDWIGCKYTDFETLLKCSINPLYRESKKRLRGFKDKHKGERCFIIGNGPSLNRMDLSPLRKEITFGLNRIYLLFDRLGYSTTYFVSVNPHVIEQSSAEINRLTCAKFISWNARRFLHFSDSTIFIRSRTDPKFYRNVGAQGAWEGATVTYVAMQLAYYMGFSEVILIGVDHNFKTEGEPHKLITSEGDDPNHFAPDYFGKGVRWQLPDLKTSEHAYTMARDAYFGAGRRILDATVDGKLNIFPKVRFEDIVR